MINIKLISLRAVIMFPFHYIMHRAIHTQVVLRKGIFLICKTVSFEALLVRKRDTETGGQDWENLAPYSLEAAIALLPIPFRYGSSPMLPPPDTNPVRLNLSCVCGSGRTFFFPVIALPVDCFVAFFLTAHFLKDKCHVFYVLYILDLIRVPCIY